MKKVKTKLFEYDEKHLQYLRNTDSLLGYEIDRIGRVEWVVIPELFPALIYAVIGQQLSREASLALWDKMQEHFEEINPDSIAAASIDDLRLCGLQATKAGYIKNIAQTIASGNFELDNLHLLSDKEAVKKLSTLHGIGIKTAETLLLSMERPNILCYEDISIRRGIMKLYSLTELKKEQFMTYKNRYSPYASVASFYLWTIAHE